MAKEKAEKTAAPAKNNAAAKKSKKKENIFKRIARPFREMAAELKKVTWPTKKELTSYCLSVLAVVVVMAVVVGLMDWLVSTVVQQWLTKDLPALLG